MKDTYLKDSWKKQGKVVDHSEGKSGWFIFLHVEDRNNMSCGYTYMWSHVVCTDGVSEKCFNLIKEERTPKCFSSEKKARDYWRNHKDEIINRLHQMERDDEWCLNGHDFTHYKVNVCQAHMSFTIKSW